MKVIQYFWDIKLIDSLLITSVLLSIFFSIAYYFIGITILILAAFYILYRFGGHSFIFICSIFSLLVVSSNLSESTRQLIQLLNFCVLLFIFLKQYGLIFNKYPIVYKPLLFIIIFLFCSMFISTIISGNYQLGANQIIRTILFFVLIYLLYGLITSNKIIKIYLSSLILTAFFSIIILFYEFSNVGFNFIKLNEQMIIMGQSFIGKNALGAILVIAFSVSTVFLFCKEFKKWFSVIFIFDFFIVVGLLITNSRAAIGALFISYFFILFKLQSKLLKRIAISVLFIIPIIMINPINELISLYFRLDSISTGRDVIFESIFKVIEQNPIFGSGPAGTKLEFYKQLPFLLGSPQEIFLSRHYNQLEYGHAHNFYLFLLSDLGLPGLIFSISFPIIFLRATFRLLSRTKNIDYKAYLVILGITASGISLFLRGFLEWGNILSYGQIRMDLPFWLLITIILYYNQKFIITKN